jgi:hypothetical protein
MRLIKIISGGQTGADRGALDAAIARGVSHGGWCPKGRRAEDGVISERYRLIETASHAYEHRTVANIENSDATLIITFCSGPSELVIQSTTRLRVPDNIPIRA